MKNVVNRALAAKKNSLRYLFAALMVLGVSVNAGGTDIATWGQVSISANTAVTASGGDANNNGKAKFKSTKAMTTKGGSGSNAYYAAAAGGSVITFYDLNLSTYTGIQISFYSRASNSGTMTLAYSVDSVSWIDINSVALSGTEGQKTITGIPYYAKYLRLTHSYKSGSLYFGTVVISGTSASSTMKAVSWSVDGEAYSTGSPTTSVPNGEKVGKLPTEPSGCSASQVFVGWSASAIDGSTNTEPSDLFRTASEAPTVSTPTTYYAVFAEASSGDPTNRVYSFASNSDASTSISAGWSMSLAPGNGYGDTYGAQWDRNGYASLPTFKFTPTARISKISIKVRQNNTTGSTSVSCNVGGTTISTSAVSGTSQYDMEFSPSASSKGQIIISCVNTSTANSGCGNFNVKSITLIEDGTTYSNYVTTCCEKHDAIFGHDGSGNDPDDQSACENISVSFTPDPAEGYEYGGATIYEDDVETQITTLSSSTTSFDMYDRDVYVLVHYVPGNYTITLNNQGATTAGTEEISVTYGSAENLDASPAITVPTKTGYTFGGYWTATAGGGVQVIDASGDVIADVDDGVDFYTSEDKEYFYPGDLTLYAKWTVNAYKLSIASVDNVVISATTPSLAEGDDPVDVNYGSTVTLSHGDPTGGKTWSGWNAYKTGDTGTPVAVDGNNQFTMPAYDVTVNANLYSDFVFSCAELTLTAHPETAGAPIFITSTAEKKVRSQGYITITGSGLTPSTALTFPGLNSKFEVLTSTGGTISTDANGEIDDVNAYIFYTPAADATTDGLDQMASLTVSVGGAKPKQVTLIQEIIGRHLPADFVIAAKRNNKWYALPDTMTVTGTPNPIEIAVDDINNPSVAYTTSATLYGLAGPTSANISGGNGQYIRFTMTSLDADDDPEHGHAPLFGSATGTAKIGKSGTAQATSNLSAGWWWKLVQKSTSITNPQDAKYQIYCANNDTTLSLKENAGNPKWGLYKNGYDELRLIPASDVIPTEAYFVEWAQHGGVVEVDAEGVEATSVVAHLGEATSSAITLVQTKASDAKNKSSKYNYTVNFGGSIDFAANEGQMLTLEWKNGETVKAVSNIVVPKIVASNITINKTNYPLKSDWNTEVHVLPGKTVTVDPSAYDGSNVTIKELNIYPGATVVASTGTLIATNLVLRNGWSRAGSKTYDVARLHVTASTATLKATNVYADWYIDYDQYYPVAVPWNATVANFSYRYSSVSPTIGPEGNIRLRYYDGASRASNVQEGVGSGANWKQYGEGGCDPVPTTLTPSNGYAMTAKRPTGKAFSIIRMPLTLPSGTWADGSWTTNGEAGNISTTHKDQVDVTAYGVKPESKTVYAEGWNFIANPYMSLYQGTITLTPEEGDATTINVVNIPDVDFKEYGQYATPTTKLNPSSGFLIQTPATGTITFGTANRKPSAPSYRKEVQTETRPEQQVYIVLNDEKAEDMMGLFVSEQYTAEYDLNGDVEKLLSDGNTLRTYMRYGDMNMAYVAINETLAKEWIPVNVRIPETGEYTYSMHEASIAGELEGVYLIDYQNGDKITNLIEQSYTFSSTAGTINGRFAINAKVGERQTPTDIDVVNGGGDLNSDKPFKFIYHEKVYIYHRGVIYDATGKRVREINK